MIKTALRGYQKEAVERALPHAGFCLFPEQRTGKTLTSLAIVDHRKPDILFILCPKKAIREWRDQMAKHLEMDWDCQVIVENFEQFSRNPKTRRSLKGKLKRLLAKGKRLFVLIDEVHRIKKRGSATSRFVRSLGTIATWRLGLTGTPIAQGIQDAFAIFDFIMPGLFGKWEDFREQYLTFGGFENRKIKGYKNEEEFNRIFHKYSYRITLKEAKRREGQKAAKIRRKKIMVRLSARTRLIYNELVEELETEINGTIVSTPMVMTLTGKLQQLTGGSLIHKTRVPGRKVKIGEVIPVGDEKLQACRKILMSLEPGKKVVICARYKHELASLQALVRSLGMTEKLIAGGQDFDGQFNTDAIVLQISSGIAIDLAESNTYIFYSWDFSYINYEQSKFRVQSFATRQVNYYFLIARATVDEDIYEAVVKKKNLATLVCDRHRRYNK
jgi:superfamily II DNA or RNA helicase